MNEIRYDGLTKAPGAIVDSLDYLMTTIRTESPDGTVIDPLVIRKMLIEALMVRTSYDHLEVVPLIKRIARGDKAPFGNTVRHGLAMHRVLKSSSKWLITRSEIEDKIGPVTHPDYGYVPKEEGQALALLNRCLPVIIEEVDKHISRCISRDGKTHTIDPSGKYYVTTNHRNYCAYWAISDKIKLTIVGNEFVLEDLRPKRKESIPVPTLTAVIHSDEAIMPILNVLSVTYKELIPRTQDVIVDKMWRGSRPFEVSEELAEALESQSNYVKSNSWNKVVELRDKLKEAEEAFANNCKYHEELLASMDTINKVAEELREYKALSGPGSASKELYNALVRKFKASPATALIYTDDPYLGELAKAIISNIKD